MSCSWPIIFGDLESKKHRISLTSYEVGVNEQKSASFGKRSRHRLMVSPKQMSAWSQWSTWMFPSQRLLRTWTSFVRPYSSPTTWTALRTLASSKLRNMPRRPAREGSVTKKESLKSACGDFARLVMLGGWFPSTSTPQRISRAAGGRVSFQPCGLELRRMHTGRWLCNMANSAKKSKNSRWCWCSLSVRRFSCGRLVTNFEAEENVFLTSSELALCGRPMSQVDISLPLSKDMLLPESLSPDEDLRQSERQRPSAEACAAQKGQARWIALLQSLLTTSGNLLKAKPVIVLNLTGYIEDVGCAVSWPGFRVLKVLQGWASKSYVW